MSPRSGPLPRAHFGRGEYSLLAGELAGRPAEWCRRSEEPAATAQATASRRRLPPAEPEEAVGHDADRAEGHGGAGEHWVEEAVAAEDPVQALWDAAAVEDGVEHAGSYGDEGDVVGEGPEQVHADGAHGAAAELDGLGDAAGV